MVDSYGESLHKLAFCFVCVKSFGSAVSLCTGMMINCSLRHRCISDRFKHEGQKRDLASINQASNAMTPPTGLVLS